MQLLKGKTVVLAVSGGIAAYKIPNLARMLIKQGARVQVVMTKNATHFITPFTFSTLTKQNCLVDTFEEPVSYSVEHVALAKQADLVLVAPATANVIGKLANGLADDMLTTTILACTCPILIAPAMNHNMLHNPMVEENIQKLSRFYTIIPPEHGMLANGDDGDGRMPSEEVLNQTREAMGLNKPFLVQYFDWLTSCLQGDFGTSYSSGKPVLGILMDRLIPTLKLAFLSLIIMLVIAVPSGIIAAIKQNKFADYLIRGITFLGISMPNFWVGLLLLYVVALKLNLLPVISIGGGFKTMILPAVTLAFAMAAKYTRQVRTAVLEELNKDYVIGAKARGLSDGKILLRHVFPNSLLPLITLLGLSLGSLLGGTAVVEVIFSYPGLGNLAVTSITAYDYPIIQAYVLWIALIYMIINLIVDLSYTLVDPKVRERG